MIDDNGILGQDESYGQGPVRIFGGGDSASWHGIYTYLGFEKRSFSGLFAKKYGGYARHPTEGYSAYYKNPWDGRITRDQLTGILAALIKQKDTAALFRVFLHHAAWLWLFAYNTRKNGDLGSWKWPDPTGPDIWSMYIRGFLGRGSWLVYPLLCVLDLHNLGNALTQKYTGTEHNMNFIVKMLVSLETCPTFVGYITKRINKREDLHKGLIKYWSGWRGEPLMADEINQKMIKDNVR